MRMFKLFIFIFYFFCFIKSYSQTIGASQIKKNNTLVGNASNQLCVDTGLIATQYDLLSIGSSGTVTSVGLSLPSELSISGSPVTTTGTLTGTWISQSAFTVFGRGSGTGTPSFQIIDTTFISNFYIKTRSLFSANLPINYSSGIIGADTTSSNGLATKYDIAKDGISVTTSDYTNSTTSLSNISGLSFSVASSSTYYFSVIGNMASSSASGVRFGISVPSGSTVVYWMIANNSATNNIQSKAESYSGGEIVQTVSASAGTRLGFQISGTIVTSGTAGTVNIQGKAAGGSTTATIYSGSLISYKKL